MPKTKRRRRKTKPHFLRKSRTHWNDKRMTYEDIKAFEELSNVIRQSIAAGLKEHEANLKTLMREAIKEVCDKIRVAIW